MCVTNKSPISRPEVKFTVNEGDQKHELKTFIISDFKFCCFLCHSMLHVQNSKCDYCATECSVSLITLLFDVCLGRLRTFILSYH